jgi:hypothetical protein
MKPSRYTPPRTIPYDPDMPCTAALRRALGGRPNQALASDLLFLERWEMSPSPGAATAMRVTQIRRANPELAAAIRAELAAAPK